MTAALVLGLAALAQAGPMKVTVDRWSGPPWVEIGWLIATDLDPDAAPGLTAAAAEVLRARARTVPAVAYTVDAVARHGGIWLTAGVPADAAAAALPALWSRLAHPTVSDAEAEAALSAAQARRRRQTLDPLALALRAARADLFAGSPQASPPSGTVQGLAAITPSDLSALLRRSMTQARVQARLAGAVPDDLDFAPRLPLGTPPQRRAVPPPRGGRRMVVVDKPGAVRALVAVARWPARAGPSCPPPAWVERLGAQRVVWWRLTAPDEVVDRAAELVAATRAPSPAPGCTEDAQAAARADPVHALDAWRRQVVVRDEPVAPAGGPPATVVVLVMALQAGVPEALSQRLEIDEVSVVPYDRP